MCNMLIQVKFSILLNIDIIKKGNLAAIYVSVCGAFYHI